MRRKSINKAKSFSCYFSRTRIKKRRRIVALYFELLLVGGLACEKQVIDTKKVDKQRKNITKIHSLQFVY